MIMDSDFHCSLKGPQARNTGPDALTSTIFSFPFSFVGVWVRGVGCGGEVWVGV